MQWYSHSVEIKANSNTEMAITQGRANVFFVINSSSANILCGLSGYPRSDSYEKMFKANSSDVFGRPTNANRVYFYNPSTADVVLQVFSAYADDFDFSILKTLSLDISGDAADAIKFDGVITGFSGTASYPTFNVKDGQNAAKLSTIQGNIQEMNPRQLEMKTTLDNIKTLLTDVKTILQNIETNTQPQETA